METQSKWRELVQLTEAWVKQDPNNPEPWMVRGRAYAKLQQADEAVQLLERVTQLVTRHAEGWYERALAYLRVGKVSEARQAYGSLRQFDSQLGEKLETRLRAGK